MKKSALFAAALVLIVSATALSAETVRDRIRQRIREHLQKISDGTLTGALRHGGIDRTYLVHPPKGLDRSRAYPVVFVFHGAGGNAENAMRMTGMNRRADEKRFIAVYPNGTGRLKDPGLTWNAWACCGEAFAGKVDDVGFVRELIARLERDYPVDPKRIFATGISNGGMLCYRLACELSDRFAAVAPVAGAMDTDDPRPSEPVSLIIFHGTEDKHIRYDGGEPDRQFDRQKRVDKPVSYAVNFWVKYDGCNPVPADSRTQNVARTTYSGGRNGTEVTLYALQGFGHAWPGDEGELRGGGAESPAQEISATDLIWEFFDTHPKV
ncbi:MAG TPA: PHB depolymerase family esterase [Candidatus Eisenbacteria bacterium]|jgi:polyhydroxybutyrate depolymerase|nr:PHB depolymerase family esterase [Candidatus Eisenbacteria bacterium]